MTDSQIPKCISYRNWKYWKAVLLTMWAAQISQSKNDLRAIKFEERKKHSQTYKSRATPWSPWWPSVCVRWTTQVSCLAPTYMWSCETTVVGRLLAPLAKTFHRLFGILSIQAFYLILYLPCLNFPLNATLWSHSRMSVFNTKNPKQYFPTLRLFC